MPHLLFDLFYTKEECSFGAIASLKKQKKNENLPKNPSISQTLLCVQPKKDLRLMSTRESESLAVPFVPLDKDGYF